MGNGQSAHPRRLTPHEVESTKIGTYTDLASSAIGGKIVERSDEFFGKAENLIKVANPPPTSQNFTEHDGEIDGWGTRRHSHGYDFVVIKLAYNGTLAGFDIDTTNFSGVHAPITAVDACFAGSGTAAKGDSTYKWVEILPKTTIDPNSHNVFSLPLESTDHIYDHIRLRIYPDGAVARFRVFGNVVPPRDCSGKLIDLAFVGNGGRVVSCSNELFGPMGNLNLPGRAADTRGGWLTRRNWSSYSKEWAVIHLGTTGLLSCCEVDTGHFRGNHPDEVSIEGCYSMEERPEDDVDISWITLLPATRVGPDAQHKFDFLDPVKDLTFTHVRVSIFPDGGLSRVRILGCVTSDTATLPSAGALKPAGISSAPGTSTSPKPRHPLSQSTTKLGDTPGSARRASKKSLGSNRSLASSTADSELGSVQTVKRKRTR